jgi:hypothetical protein
LLAAPALAAAQGVSVSAYPPISVANNRSQITFTAFVVNNNGRAVPNGTRVVFTSTLGEFRESIVTTTDGVARAVLVAGGVPGIATITVRSLGAASAPATLEYEFVSDASLISSDREYAEVYSPESIVFAVQQRVLAASAPNRGVVLRYRDITLECDDLQLDTNSLIAIARRARLRFGKVDQVFEELNLRLPQRRGIGTTTFESRRIETLVYDGKWFTALAQREDGTWEIAPLVPRFGLVEIRSTGLAPTGITPPSNAFTIADLSDSPSSIRARKVVVSPRRGIQFTKAGIYVADTRVLNLELYQLSASPTQSPIVADQFISIRENQLSVDYPYYLSLSPGQTSLLRLRSGQQFGRSTSATQGVFLDYELSWNRGDAFDGGMRVTGIARDDWSVSARQYWRPNDRESIFFEAQTPAGRSLYGSLNYNNQFSGFSLSANANASTTLRGVQFDQQDATLSLEKDPIKMGKFPARLFTGLTTVYSRSSASDTVTRGVGAFARVLTNPLRTPIGGTLVASAAVRQLASQQGEPPALFANATYTRNLGPSANATLTYDFAQDNASDQTLGRHRFGLDAAYEAGRVSASNFLATSLGVERLSVFTDLSYHVGGPWRLFGSYTLDRLLGETFLDYSLGLGYRIAFREIGLQWSQQTGRISFQVVGARF